MKRCEICDRQIKTGWKYCYEHRNSKQEFSKEQNHIFKEGERSFKRYEFSKNYNVEESWKALLLFTIAGIIFLYGLIFLTPYWYIIVPISFIIFFYGYRLQRRRYDRLDYHKESISPEYDAYISSYVKTRLDPIRRKKEFKKKLFR